MHIWYIEYLYLWWYMFYIRYRQYVRQISSRPTGIVLSIVDFFNAFLLFCSHSPEPLWHRIERSKMLSIINGIFADNNQKPHRTPWKMGKAINSRIFFIPAKTNVVTAFMRPKKNNWTQNCCLFFVFVRTVVFMAFLPVIIRRGKCV